MRAVHVGALRNARHSEATPVMRCHPLWCTVGLVDTDPMRWMASCDGKTCTWHHGPPRETVEEANADRAAHLNPALRR